MGNCMGDLFIVQLRTLDNLLFRIIKEGGMSFTLRDVPISYKGELNEVKLIQFTLDPQEAQENLPLQFKPLIRNGRALVSLVDVHLTRMRPAVIQYKIGLSYRHIAFRFLIDDRSFTEDGKGHGIYFVKSFTNSAYVTYPAHLLTYYRLGVAQIQEEGAAITVQQGDSKIEYTIGTAEPTLAGTAFENWHNAREIIGVVDRAYAVNKHGQVVVTQIVRPEWPIVPIDISKFQTNFFSTAQLECGFEVKSLIPYTWLAPRIVKECLR
jgi:uncharacterized protein YqjF (DUF2071 family)